MELRYTIVNYPPFYYPLWKRIFPENLFEDGAILVWGKRIHNRDGGLPIPLIRHEIVHLKQQKNSYIYGIWWLIKYIFSIEFRLSQEIPAHQAEFREILRINPKYAQLALKSIAKRLSSPIYGGMIDLETAIKLVAINDYQTL